MTWEEWVTTLYVTEWGRRLGLAVTILLGVFIIVSVFTMFSTWYADATLVKHSAALALAENDIVSELPNAHLFGKPGAAGYVPITSLDLRLVGIIKTTPEDLSKVIISEGGKPGKVYQVGDTLESGVTIDTVEDDGVILENAGHMEKLPMQRPRLLFQGMPKSLDIK